MKGVPRMSITQEEKIRQVTEKTIVVGVDIASETHWVRAFDWRGLELGKVLSFANSAEGFAQMKDWVEEIAERTEKGHVMVGIEPTGHYWFTFAAYLKEVGMKLVLVSFSICVSSLSAVSRTGLTQLIHMHSLTPTAKHWPQ